MAEITLGELGPYVDRLIAEGRFANESEAVQAALAAFKGIDRLIAANESEMRARIEQGIAELDRGEGRPFDPGEIRHMGEDLLNKR